MGGAKRNPGSKHNQRQAPEGAEEQTGPFLSVESDVRRAFNDTRNMTTRHPAKTVHGTVN